MDQWRLMLGFFIAFAFGLFMLNRLFEPWRRDIDKRKIDLANRMNDLKSSFSQEFSILYKGKKIHYKIISDTEFTKHEAIDAVNKCFAIGDDVYSPHFVQVLETKKNQ